MVLVGLMKNAVGSIVGPGETYGCLHIYRSLVH
jgi:hypothetical protein